MSVLIIKKLQCDRCTFRSRGYENEPETGARVPRPDAIRKAEAERGWVRLGPGDMCPGCATETQAEDLIP